MRLTGTAWLQDIVEKLASKHGVSTEEVEEILSSTPRFRRIAKGNVKGEDLYAAMGQTSAGRYLVVFFVRKSTGEALVISAREMDPSERKSYAKK
jgi:uncharacterized DUF497 family protein